MATRDQYILHHTQCQENRRLGGHEDQDETGDVLSVSKESFSRDQLVSLG